MLPPVFDVTHFYGTGKGRGTSLHGGSLYFSFHQKWSKLDTFLQSDSNEAEMKKKFLTLRSVIGPSFDSAF
jgi:hypothetical protein